MYIEIGLTTGGGTRSVPGIGALHGGYLQDHPSRVPRTGIRRRRVGEQ
jgi:hypothetical protein